ncbi:hypothetical protein ACLBQX_28095, partial [Klebsiella pneumoniae]
MTDKAVISEAFLIIVKASETEKGCRRFYQLLATIKPSATYSGRSSGLEAVSRKNDFPRLAAESAPDALMSDL